VAVDDSGTVYVADAGNSRVQVFSSRPHVLLVHGLCGSTSDWSVFAGILGDSGYVVHTVQLGPTTYSTTPQQQMLSFTAAIKALHTDNLAVISHSMGGVVTRSYMERQARLGQPNPVSTLITLGTPHHGSDFVSYALSVRARLYQGLIGLALRDTYDSLLTKAVPCLGDARSTDALIDMSPGSEYLNKLNYGADVSSYDKGIFGSRVYVNGWSSHEVESGLRPETYYATLAGTRTACQWLDGPMWGIGPFAHRSDGVIAIESARLTSTATMRALDVELPTRMLTHAHTAFLCGTEYRSLDTLAWKLKTIMQDHPSGPPVSNVMAVAPRVTAITAVAEDSLQLRPAILDNVAAGGMRDIAVSVMPSSRLYVTLYSRDAVLSRFTPLGVPITAADTSSTIHHMGEGGSGHDGFIIGNPAPGTWTIHVDCTASGASQRTAAIVGVTSSYAATMWGASDVVIPGDSVTVRGTLLLAATPQTGVTWTCKAILPDSSSGTVVLFDDGVHGDSLSGDGIYGARVGTSAGTGTYWIVGRASVGASGEFGARMAFIARQPHDLYIGVGDLQMIKNVAGVSDSVLLLVTVRNADVDAAFDVGVSVSDKRFGVVMYDGEIDIPANGATVISVPWRVDIPDTHTVEVVISPYVFEYESNYDNNVLERQVVLGEPLGVDPSHEGLDRLVMLAPRPNPGVQGAVLEFVLPRGGAATLDVFDVLGRRVRGWSWASLQAGAQRVRWDGRDAAGNAVPPGVFLCRLQAGGMVGTQKLIVRP
jgi:triacylglycerol esterase/lipase EstA (alpha/beta hydrolase family)